MNEKKKEPTPKNPQKANPLRRISECFNSENKKRFWRRKMIERSNAIFIKEKQ